MHAARHRFGRDVIRVKAKGVSQTLADLVLADLVRAGGETGGGRCRYHGRRLAHRMGLRMRRPRDRSREIEFTENTTDRTGRKRLSLSVIVPTQNDGHRLQACLAPLTTADRRGIDLEILLAAGDSTDETAEIAEVHGARVLQESGSRGHRLQAAARMAVGEWLLFLRPETLLDRGWDATIMVFTSDERNKERAATFTLTPIGRTEDALGAARAARIRNRWLGLPDGRQGLLIHKRTLSRLGGVPDLETGEDLVLARRLGSRRTALFDVAARVETDDSRSSFANAMKLILFSLRVPAKWLQRLGD